ncbi:MAG: serine/threonine-protein kinase [Pseudomonadota bacterium]
MNQSTELWRQAQEHYERLATLPETDRAIELTSLPERVRELVEAIFEQEITESKGDSDAPAAVLLDAIDQQMDPWIDRSLGAYRLTRKLGQGGMGAVYLAERDDTELDMQVAIKLVPNQVRGEEGLRRFQRERQILANLDHPNIARLFDGGSTDDGVPFLVMQFVDGRNIADFAGDLPLRQKLELFQKVCAAVQHAHRNLIIHRDIKPSNVMVTPSGEPMLLDFGIAKALGDGEGAEWQDDTATGMRFMSLRYASPEQVRGEPLTTATDVYSLGVLLAELLSGRSPYQPADMDRVALQQAICKGEVVAPSELLGKTSANAARPLKGDLDNIVLKALRKEPERRYESIAALAQDIENHLTGMPVSARPDTLWYRTSRFIGRHRVGVAISLAVVAMTAFQQYRVIDQRNVAEASAETAALERDKAEQTRDFLIELFQASDPTEALGEEITARQMLDRGASTIDDLNDNPELQAAVLVTIGRLYRLLGLYDEATALLERSLALSRERASTEAIAESAQILAMTRMAAGDYETATALMTEAVALIDARHGGDSLEAAGARVNLAKIYWESSQPELVEQYALESSAILEGLEEAHPQIASENAKVLGYVASANGDYPLAEAHYREAVRLQRAHREEANPFMAAALMSVGHAQFSQGDYAGAADTYREALVTMREVYGEVHPQTAGALMSLGALESNLGNQDVAEKYMLESLEVNRELLGDDHLEIATTLNNLAFVIVRKEGDLGDAEANLREALAITRKQLGDNNSQVARSLSTLGWLLSLRGKIDEAAGAYEASLAMNRELLEEGHIDLAPTLTLLAHLRHRQGNCETSLAASREAMDIFEATGSQLPNRRQAEALLGTCLSQRGDYEEAERRLLVAHEAYVEAGSSGKSYRDLLGFLVLHFETRGMPQEAATYQAMLDAAQTAES